MRCIILRKVTDREAMTPHKHSMHQQIEAATRLFNANSLAEAHLILSKIIAAQPECFDALRLLAFIAGKTDDFATAAQLLTRALRLEPRFIEGWYYLGMAQMKCDRPQQALMALDQALALYPDFFEAVHDRGLALLELGRIDEAVACLSQAVRMQPGSPQAWTNLGVALGRKNAFAEEAASYQRALAIDPDNDTAKTNIGMALVQSGQYLEAIAIYEKRVLENPDLLSARGQLILTKLRIADWQNLPLQIQLLAQELHEAERFIEPFNLAALPFSAAVQLQNARRYTQAFYPPRQLPQASPRQPRADNRIRVAYVSADFHAHATAFLAVEMFEKHDRSNFEIIAIAFGDDDHSAMRTRLRNAFDQFIDVSTMNDQAVAALIQTLQVDILVDLKGFTNNARVGIFAYKAAPIQISYLGYPGSSGADYIDYIVADHFVITPQDEPFYSEAVVYLPHCYQVNGKNRQTTATPASRAAVGLAEQAFVFCSFNHPYKNNAAMFDIWMRLLNAIDHAVLWLLAGNPQFEQHIRQEAASRGVHPDRIIFAPMTSPTEHLARIQLADLFLDSLPYTAHTTASDALWMNVPVLSCVGEAFPGRVGQSILHAVEMPELIAQTPEQYYQLALQLASDRQALAAIKTKLREKVKTSSLYDSQGFTTQLEWSYRAMMQRHNAGLAPARIEVPDLRKACA